MGRNSLGDSMQGGILKLISLLCILQGCTLPTVRIDDHTDGSNKGYQTVVLDWRLG